MPRTLVLLFFLFLPISKVCAQNQNVTFELYTHLNGLSNSHVNCIIQDTKGFMWFGTDYGINKFDGFEFVNYTNDPNDENSLPSDEASAFYLDKNGFLWVGTFNGLAKFDHITEKFKTFLINKDSVQFYKPVRAIIGDEKDRLWVGTSGNGVLVIDINTASLLEDLTDQLNRLIGNELVYSLLIDKNNNLWVGTEENGLKVFNINTKKIKHYTTENSAIKNNYITTLFEDKKGNIWIGTRGGGLSIFDSKKEEFKSSLYIADIKDEIYSITYSNVGDIWIGTNDGGLIIFNPETNQFSKHKAYEAEDLFKSKRIRALFTDKDGNIWLGIHQLGIGIMKNYDYPFQNTQIGINKKFGYTNNSVLGLLVDSRNNLWLGTDGNGVLKYNLLTHEHKHYQANKFDAYSLPVNVARTIYEDKQQNIWIGTYYGGLVKYNRASDNFKNFKHIKNDPSSLSYDDVVALTEDDKGNLWIATNGGGLNLYNAKTNTFKKFSTGDIVNRTNICSNWLTCLFFDSKGFLWIGTFWGLSRFDTKKLQFKNYFAKPDNNSSLSNNIVYAINEDKNGNIWIGTRSGLGLLYQKSGTFHNFGIKDGLPGEVINSILADNNNNFWLATNNGLSRFNYLTKKSKNFTYQDGLLCNEFIHNSRHKTTDGRFFFGNVYGFNSFHPDSIPVEDYFSKVLITDFKIFNKSVPIGKIEQGRTILKKSITETKSIELEYSDNSFSFDFVALDYILPERMIYACKMDGFEKNWNILDFKRRFITYTNLDPGSYTFMVKASSRKDEWGEKVTKINITIHPPIWRTVWAYIIYIVLFMGTTLFIWKLNFDRLADKNKLRIERIKQAQVDKLNQSKLEFFTNISHEFRTPLTLIIGPIENLLAKNKLNAEIKKSLNMMSRNAHRLLRLVNQLLDLRKIEKGKLKLEARKTDLIQFITEIFQSFDELAKQKNIQFTLENETKTLVMYFDHDKMDKILFNLLSNAFKFTENNGKIELSIKKSLTNKSNSPDGIVKIFVKDNGRGMSKEHVSQIFERFYQSPGEIRGIQKGTGIGLSLTKSLVDIHHGQLSVVSKKGLGSKFIVELPLGKKHLSDEEIIEEQLSIAEGAIAQQVVVESPDDNLFKENSVKPANENAPLILLVEDNKEVRTYIKKGLIQRYKIAEAENGKEGIQKTHELMPDLIISDVMMPELDGIEFCKKIKTDLVSCHIPVILLTAKSSMKHRIEGLETGADSYIPKPFNPKHLLVRIKKLLELRQKLKEKFKKESDFEPIKMAITSADEKFMKKAVNTIKERISDTGLGVESLSEEIGMDRSHLYRKLKGLVGQTPSEFIRTIRLKQAAHLLSNEDIPVSEVCYLVGFNSPSYFASCFNKKYKLTPTQYKEKHFTNQQI